jgi:hypothetical protein
MKNSTVDTLQMRNDYITIHGLNNLKEIMAVPTGIKIRPHLKPTETPITVKECTQ